MARPRKNNIEEIPEDLYRFDIELDDYVHDAMAIYGHYINEDRAVPDFRDGLKPVQRRVLWAMSDLNLYGKRGVLSKSARVVGDAMGKYHPHGNKSVYDALVAMTHTSYPTVFGSGNFGSLVADAAAERYTECRLTHYSDTVFFDSLYKADSVTPKVENFDGSEKEPIILSATIPNLLLNGAFGIGLGSRCSIPAFELEGVVKLAKMAISGKSITPKIALKYLVPKSHAGGMAYVDDEETQAELLEFYTNGEGSVYWIPKAELDVPNKTIKISGFAPSVTGNLETVMAKVGNDDRVATVLDSSYLDNDKNSVLERTITLKGNIAARDTEDALWDIAGYFDRKQSLMFTITERLPPEKDSVEVNTRFFKTNITDFFKMWADWRIKLERKAIINQRDIIRAQLEHDNLLLLAVINRDIIIECLDEDDSEQVLIDRLDITREQAAGILNMRIRQLKALEEKPLRKRIAQAKKDIKVLRAEHKAPANRISLGIDASVKSITGDK